MVILGHILNLLNLIAGKLADLFISPLMILPGWLSLLLISLVTGVLMLLVYKYTSNQQAIKQTRDKIQANLLALSLFRDNLGVTLSAQWGLLKGAGGLLIHSFFPMLVMIIPTCLLLGQMSRWYLSAPLPTGAESVITVYAHETIPLEKISLLESEYIEIAAGPVKVTPQKMVSWKIKAVSSGQQQIEFQIENQKFNKSITIGQGFLATSIWKPDWSLLEMLLYPAESPFEKTSPIQKIEVVYPTRESWIYGSNTWVISWLVMSMIFGFLARPWLKVNL